MESCHLNVLAKYWEIPAISRWDMRWKPYDLVGNSGNMEEIFAKYAN